jgi:phosphatidate cytidylyltransferase
MNNTPDNPQKTSGVDRLLIRFLTGIAATVFGLMVFGVGTPLVQLAGMAIAMVVAYEWSVIVRKSSRTSLPMLMMIIAVGATTGLTALGQFLPAALVLAGSLVACAALAYRSPVERFWLPLGILYAAVPWSLLITLFVVGGAGPWILFIGLSLVINADIAAYFAGKHLGGPKLAPVISPAKTWIGLLMGVAGGYVVAQVMVTWSSLTPWTFALAAPLFAAISQLSDLMESGFKRRFGVKDASKLLPGHGGVMDRMDGMTLTSVALMVFYLSGWY